jgi:hypothetical protein
MAKDSTGTNTAMAAEAIQPLVKGGRVVSVNLIFDGIAFNPANLFNALKTQYGAAKVSSDRDSTARGSYTFRIIP